MDVSASSSPRHFTTRGSPDYGRPAGPSTQQPFGTAPSHNGRPYQPSPHDSRDFPRHTDDRIPPRPSSQPAGYAIPPRDEGPSSTAPRPPTYGAAPRPEPGRPYGSGPSDRPGVSTIMHERPVTVHPVSQSAYNSPHDHRQDVHTREDAHRKEDYTPIRTGFRNSFMPQNQQPPQGPSPPRSHPQNLDPFKRPADNAHQGHTVDAIHGIHRGGMHSQPPERTEQQPDGTARTSFYEPQPRNPGEPMHRSRSFLSAGADRRGRASPLPQAVQGAQAQLSGPSGDPSIKSEFGRIFQGLGSGLGGHLPGVSTPSRQSPMPGQRNSEDFGGSNANDMDGVKMNRMSSRGGSTKKGRRVKDEDKMDAEGNDGRRTPVGRNNKRTRAGHHHHLAHAQP